MIPSVKLDFSHVQAKCGSLDKIQHAAGGGNVSDISNNPSLQALSFLTNFFIQVWIIVVECFSSFSITYSIFTKHNICKHPFYSMQGCPHVFLTVFAL